MCDVCVCDVCVCVRVCVGGWYPSGGCLKKKKHNSSPTMSSEMIQCHFVALSYDIYISCIYVFVIYFF